MANDLNYVPLRQDAYAAKLGLKPSQLDELGESCFNNWSDESGIFCQRSLVRQVQSSNQACLFGAVVI
jgi:hypothetical protein